MTVYEWDEAKAARDKRVHGISFEQAAIALEDPDPTSSQIDLLMVDCGTRR